MRSLEGLMSCNFVLEIDCPESRCLARQRLVFANRTSKVNNCRWIGPDLPLHLLPLLPLPLFPGTKKKHVANQLLSRWWWYKGVLSWNFTKISGSQGFQNTRQKDRQQVRQTPFLFLGGVRPVVGNTLVYDYPTLPQTKEATGDTAHQNSLNVPFNRTFKSQGRINWKMLVDLLVVTFFPSCPREENANCSLLDEIFSYQWPNSSFPNLLE